MRQTNYDLHWSRLLELLQLVLEICNRGRIISGIDKRRIIKLHIKLHYTGCPQKDRHNCYHRFCLNV